MWPGTAPRKDAMAIGKEVYEVIPDEIAHIDVGGGADYELRKIDPSATRTEKMLDTTQVDHGAARDTFNNLEQNIPRKTYSTIARTLETPAQRLSRLRAELAQIETETREIASSWEVRQADDEEAVDYAGKPFQDTLNILPDAFFAEIEQLKGVVTKLSDSPSWQEAGLVEGDASGRDVTRMKQELDKLTTILKDQEQRENSPSVGGVEAKGSITFELYGVKQTPHSVVSQSRIVELEKRLGILENGLGLSKTTHLELPYRDLYAGLKDVAQKLVLLDSAKVAAVAKRVAELTTEIDNFVAKKRGKMGWEGSSNLATAEVEMPSSYQSSEDLQVSEIYDLCHKWRSASASLPWVVHRLKLLQSIHVEAATITARVSDLEKRQDELDGILAEEKSRMTELGQAVMQHIEWSKNIVGNLNVGHE